MQGDKDVDWVAFECGSSVCVGGVEKIVSYITRMSLSLGVISLSLLSSQSLLLTMGLNCHTHYYIILVMASQVP